HTRTCSRCVSMRGSSVRQRRLSACSSGTGNRLRTRMVRAGVDTEISKWFSGAKRVMFVHAHPDDETIATGGTLAALAEAGLEPLVVTLTRGERGEVVDGPLAHLAGTDGLAPHRQAELAAALAMLGVERHAFLGVPPARAEGLPPTIYEDSGMAWQ